MKFAPATTNKSSRFFARDRVSRVQRSTSAFTLAEALAALLFLAIVIPIAVQGLHIASLAGEVAQRKGIAARVAERVLNENIASTNWNKSSQSGSITEGVLEFGWKLQSESWSQNATNVVGTGSSGSLSSVSSGQPVVNAAAASQTALTLVSVEVGYLVQNRPYYVRLSTLVNAQQ